MRRSATLVLALVLALTLYASPGSGQSRGGQIVFALYQEPENLNPYIYTQTAAGETAIFVVEGALAVNEKGEYIPDLAAEVPTVANKGVSADGKTITVRLKPGVTWSDGRPLTCDDFQFTWQAVMHPQSGAVSTAGFRDIEAVNCPNPTTVVYQFKTFYAPYLSLLTSPALPKHATGDPANMQRWAYNRQPLGTGPFRLTEWVSGDHITLVRNERYREKGKPYLDRVIIRIIPSREVGKQLIRTGEIDVLWDLVEADVPELNKVQGVKISSAPGPGAERLVLNLADPTLDGTPPEEVATHPHPILADVRVREAIELMINKREINTKLLFGLATIGTNELHIGWAKCVTPPSTYNPARARRLLDEAGWKPGPDGIRVAQGAKYAKDGTRLRLKLQTTTGNKLREQVEQVLIEYARAVGLEFYIENVPSAVLFGSWASGAFRKHGKFDVVMYTTNPDVDPHGQIDGYFASWNIPTAANQGAGFNYARWANPKVDAAIKLAGSNPDAAVRRKAYCDAMRELVRERPHIYLYDRASLDAYRDRLQGWITNVWDRLGWNAQDWTVRR